MARARARAVRCFWPAGEGDAALAHEGLEPLGELRHVLGRAAPPPPPSARARSRPSSAGMPEGHVLADRLREEERLLRHVADGPAQRGQGELAHVVAVHEHRARRRLEQARDEGHQRALAGAGGPDDGHRGARGHLEVDVAQHGPAVVGEGEVAQLHVARGSSVTARGRRGPRSPRARPGSRPCRPMEASPRSKMFTTQPSAIIGQCSMVR